MHVRHLSSTTQVVLLSLWAVFAYVLWVAGNHDLVLASIFFGVIGWIIGKRNSFGDEGFLWGVLLGPLGWIIMAISSSED